MIFAPYPDNPAIGENSTLNFSVLQNGANLFNIYASVKVHRSTGALALAVALLTGSIRTR